MKFALVFMADDLKAAHVAEIQSWCDYHVLRFSISPRWLSAHKALELIVEDTPRPDQWQSLKTLLKPHKIDVLITPTEHRRKKLLLADMDSTIVTTETLDELSHAAGLKDKVAAITARAMNGEIGFHEALIERVALLKGLNVSLFEEVLNATKLTEGAQDLVQTMRFYGAQTALVSSGFLEFIEPIAARVGFHHAHGNKFEIENNGLSGKVIEPIQDKQTKLEILNSYKENLHLKAENIIAVGDGANDIPMLQAAGLGVGFYPKPIVAQSVQNTIEFTNLRALLYIQGYSDLDIEAAKNSSHKKLY